MVRLAANISTLFSDLPLADRVLAAADHGFRGIELQFLPETGLEEIAAAARRREVEVVLFNAAPGDTTRNQLGLAGLVEEVDRFHESMEEALVAAAVFDCRRIHVLAGRRVSDTPLAEQRRHLVASLAWAAERAATAGVMLLIEPLNARLAPDYLVGTLEDALQLVDASGSENIQVQFDLFHLQVMGGDITTRFDAALPRIGHVQVAATPSRAEPDWGELNIPFIFDHIDRTEYAGWIGCEYFPKGDTSKGLDWAIPYGIARPKQ